MPNIKSAKKRVLVSAKKTNINKSEKSEVKTYIKNFNLLLENGNVEEAEKVLSKTVSVIDKAVTKGILTKNAAANKKSGLVKKFNALKASK